MTVRKFLFIFSIEFFLIFCFTTSIAFGMSSNNNETIQSGDSLNSEISNVNFGYYQDFFGLDSYGNTVITRFGKLPLLETREQKENWNSSLKTLSDKIKDNITSKYMYPYGQIVACGSSSNGYFVILFNYGNVTESLINEIYAHIDNSAREMDIQNIPVEFGYGTYKQEILLNAEKGIYHEFGENTDNFSESDIHATQEFMKTKPVPPAKCIAAYGKIPLFKDQKEIISWGDRLFYIFNSTQEKINPYMERDQLIVYGVEITRLHVGINESLSSREKITIIREIYQIIDDEARKQNITDIPVYFDEGTFINDLGSNDIGVSEDKSNLSTTVEKNEEKLHDLSYNNSGPSDESNFSINKSGEAKSNKNNFVPGFGLFISLICLHAGWKLRKK